MVGPRSKRWPSFQMAEPRPPGVTGETWQFGPLNRWAYTHLREVLPTKDIPNDYRNVRPLPGIEAAANELDLVVDGNQEHLSEAMASWPSRTDASSSSATPAR